MDSQTSADVQDVSKFGLPNADGAGGACTNAMLLTLVSARSTEVQYQYSITTTVVLKQYHNSSIINTVVLSIQYHYSSSINTESYYSY